MSELARALQLLASDSAFVNLRSIPNLAIDLRYASTNNILGRDIYGPFNEPYLHREAATKLAHASLLLTGARPDLRMVVFDALRPRSVQRVLWSHVVGTPEQPYIADPDRGSIHNYGCAIDLGLVDLAGRELDMGTGFDAFVPLSEPRREYDFLATGQLTREQQFNRLMLRHAMAAAGFVPLEHEWWHFDAFGAAEVRERFQLIE